MENIVIEVDATKDATEKYVPSTKETAIARAIHATKYIQIFSKFRNTSLLNFIYF